MMIEDGKMWIQFFSQEPLLAEIPAEIYEKISKDLSAKLDAAGNDAFVVDLDRAKKLLNS